MFIERTKFGTKFFIACILIGSLFTPGHFASADVSISLYPVSFRIQADPGTTWNGTITVTNPNSSQLGVQPEKENLGGGAEGSIQLLGADANSYGLASWIKINANPSLLQPGEKKDFPFSIHVPSNATPGGHYAAVLFRAIPPEQAGGAAANGVGVSGRVGSVVLLEVSGDVKRSATLETVDAPQFLSHGPFTVTLKIGNTGNSYFNPGGAVTFQNLLWKQDVSWDPRVVFPGFDRTFTATWDRRYAVGPVFATVLAKMPDGTVIGQQTVVIWSFPWQESLIGAGALVLIWLGIREFKKRFKIVPVGK